MKTKLRSIRNSGALLALVTLLLMPGLGWGQNISTSTPYSQDFDAIGSTATATLPTGWKIENVTGARTVTTAYASVANTATANALTYNAAMSSSAANGRWNFGGSSATDRAVGGISSGSASQSVNMYLQLTNNGASNIESFTINYDAERFRNGSNSAGFSIRLYYSTTGSASSYSEIADGIASFTANANNNGSTTTPETISKTNITLSQALSVGSSIYFVWSYSVTSGSTTSNAQALGIDNLSITAIGSADVTPPSWTALYPKAENATTSGFTAMVNINEPGTSYLVVLPDGAAAPSSAQVKAGQDAAGNVLANNLKGTISCLAASTEYTLAMAGLSASTAYDVYFVAQDDETTPNLQANPVKVDVSTAAAATPIISITGTFSAFSTIVGTPSVSQSVAVSGSNLTANIDVTALAGFEYSTTDADPWTSSLSLSSSFNGNVYVRLTGASVGSYNGNVSFSSTGATTVDKAVNGSVTAPPPVITVTGSFSAFTATTGTPSVSQSVVVSGSNLTENIGVSAVAGYEYSTTDADP
ncbi:MAG: hypothetical protein IPN08_10575 [Bacteroidales bacterium]|nr:hypothetical protein [Bacteroidales bacterium]